MDNIEDGLFNMFKHINMSPSTMMRNMVAQYERVMLTEIQKQIRARLKELSHREDSGETGYQSSMFNEDINPFTILGVDITATEDEVKAAYRKKSWDAHPDHGGSNESMARVNAAFEVIKRFKGWK